MSAPVVVEPRSPEAIRKEVQRNRDKAMGITRTEVSLSSRDLDLIRFGCMVRGGLVEPYSLNEYMATLIRCDHERLKAELASLEGETCEQCNRPLPLGCGGEHPGYATCWFTRGPRSLLL